MTHEGVEMGQGLHTKVAQVILTFLQLCIHIRDHYGQVGNCMLYGQNNLYAHGFYVTPDIGLDWETCTTGNVFRHFTCGAAFTEVEIDTLTGDFHASDANVILDLGYSLNPAIDIGQISNFANTLGGASRWKEQFSYSLLGAD